MLTRYIFREDGQVEVKKGIQTTDYKLNELVYVDDSTISTWIKCTQGGMSNDGARFEQITPDQVPKEYLAKLMLLKG